MDKTLQAIERKYAEIGEMIEALKAQPKHNLIETRRATTALMAGETYVGAIINADGSAYAIILLPGECGESTWEEAISWADFIDGSLPTRVEQAMLYANHRDKFENRFYWSCEQHETIWCQDFRSGGQSYFNVGNRFSARAVRRVAL